jgi:hypothetical protein
MSDLLAIIAVIAVWVLLQKVVFPKLGVPV